jgi:hypothetical protein
MKKLIFIALLALIFCQCKKEQSKFDIFKGWELIEQPIDYSISIIKLFGGYLESVDTLNGIYDTYKAEQFKCIIREDIILSYVETIYENNYLGFEAIRDELNKKPELILIDSLSGTIKLTWYSDKYIYILDRTTNLTYITVSDRP